MESLTLPHPSEVFKLTEHTASWTSLLYHPSSSPHDSAKAKTPTNTLRGNTTTSYE